MNYQNPKGKNITVENQYQVDIISDILTAGKDAGINLQTGWFPAKPRYPAVVFYLLAAPIGGYISNKARSAAFTYYFEVRALDEARRDKTARDLCSALAGLYSARRSQFDDSFEETTGTYIKRITFTFTIYLGV